MGNIDKTLALAVETSGRKGSVAVGTGDEILAEGTLSGHLRHGSELLGCCDALLRGVGAKASYIRHVYIGAGPGSFTGIRIAVTVAKTMNFACGAKIFPVGTMDVLAANTTELPQDRHVRRLATVLDAKRGQFYIAVFDRRYTRWRKSVHDCLMTSSQFIERFAGGETTVWLLGEGLVYYRDQFAAEGIALLDESLWYPRAANVYNVARQKAQRGEFADPLTLTPRYLRDPEAVVKKRP